MRACLEVMERTSWCAEGACIEYTASEIAYKLYFIGTENKRGIMR